MPLTFDATLGETLRHRSNAYDPITADFETRTGLGWHQPTPAEQATAQLSVVIPAHNMAYSLPAVLDALLAQDTGAPFEVIVVDDASSDDTLHLARKHAAATMVVQTPQPVGAAAARNLGTALAEHDTVVYLDADMVLPEHALADIAARAQPQLVLLGFRHNVPHTPDASGRPLVPAFPADLNQDHRVHWRPPAGKRLIYSGITLNDPLEGRPLDATDELRQLGFARTYYDWDLPRMVVTALLAAPRAAVLDIGGFHPEFGKIGWGSEDTHLGAALIAAGLMVAPLRQLVGYHLDPPDADAQWAAKLATWPDTVAFYRQLLTQPPVHGRTRAFLADANTLLARCEVTQ
jgi:GT2 family glycosyltransferase